MKRCQSSKAGLAVFVFALSLLFTGCTTSADVKGLSQAEKKAALCKPTGNSVSNTGVYIGPDACESVTLYPIGRPVNGVPTAYVLFVGYPVYGEHPAVKLTNTTTGDTREKIVYSGDPDLALYMGDYALGGLKVAEGNNDIQAELWDLSGDTGLKHVISTSNFKLNVVKSATRAKDDSGN